MTTEDQPRRGPGVREGLTANLVGAALLLAVGAAVAASGALLGMGVAGRPQALGAVLGAGLVTGCCAFGAVTVSLVTAYAPRASLLVALLTYTLQVGALALVLAGVQGSSALRSSVDVAWTGGAVVTTTVVWLAVLVVTALRGVPRPREAPGRASSPVSERGVGV